MFEFFSGMRLLFLVLLVNCHSWLLTAQPGLNHRLYTTENGLSYDQIECITQDKSGFLWVATFDGLSRFDGYEFRNYFHKSGDTTSFPFFSLDKIVADKYNCLWVFSEGRPPVYYNRSTDNFSRLRPGTGKSLLLNDITLGPDSIIWFTAGMTAGWYDSGRKKQRLFSIRNESHFRFSSDKPGLQVLFDNRDGIWCYYTEGKEYKILKGSFTYDSTLVLRPFGSISFAGFRSAGLHNTTGNISIHITDTGDHLFFTRYGLYCFDPGSGRFARRSKPPGTSFPGRKPFYTWTDDETGIHILDTKNGNIRTINTGSENYTETTFIDNTGIIWTGNVNSMHLQMGLNQYIDTPDKFRNYVPDPSKSSIPLLVTQLAKDRGNRIWVASGDRLNLVEIRPDGREIIHLLHGPGGKPDKSPVNAILPDSAGIWIGTDSQLLFFDFNTATCRVCSFEENGKTSSTLAVRDLIRKDNKLIINGTKGIYMYDTGSGKLELRSNHSPEGTGFSMAPDGRGGYWIGTYSNTVFHLNSELRRDRNFRIGNEYNVVQWICPGDSNDLWVALMGEGLAHYLPQTGKTEIYTTAEGLSNNVPHSILKDRKGILWISTNQGISRFDPATRHFRNFGKADGLQITVFSPGASWSAPDGEMLFGGTGGFAGFYPDSTDTGEQQYFRTSLILTDFRISGIPRHFSKPVYELDTVRLKKEDNNFQVTFASPGFRDQEKIRYRYRLIGDNQHWTETDFRGRTVSFAQLSHNEYNLEIQATDQDGQWTYSKAVVILIPAYFRETAGFRILLIIAATLAIFLLLNLYVRHIRINALQVQNELRLESLKGQMNPHFIFNSLNSINYFIMKEDKLSANDYITDFSRLMRSFLDNLSNDYIPLKKELDSLKDYLKLEHLRFSDKFDYKINFTDSDMNLDLQDILVLPGLIQPFVENAILHGVRNLDDTRKGMITVTIGAERRDLVWCTIEDDGIGRLQSGLRIHDHERKKSRGINIVLERLKIINNQTNSNYQVIIKDLFPEKKETGTSVYIQLPVKSEK